MRVIVYTAVDDKVPLNFKHVAIIVQDGERMPVQFHGADAETLRTKAQKFWNDAMEKDGARKPRKPRKPRRPKAEPDGVTIDDIMATDNWGGADDVEDSI